MKIPPLPPKIDLRTVPVLEALAEANGLLGEMKGEANSLPNPNILLDTLFLQEALASSEIENIVTTQDEAYEAMMFTGSGSVEAKEVARYNHALRSGYKAWQAHHLLTENLLIEMFRVLKKQTGGYRKVPGTNLVNERTGEVVYELPLQSEREISAHMSELEKFINDDGLCALHPLIKMALIHHQFESIHPFPDGNGRVGRMLNVLYLTHSRLLDQPILYLSRAINRTKDDYYRLLQAVRTENAWEEWVVYMLRATTESARSTLWLIREMRQLSSGIKHRLRSALPRIYSQDLLNNLFRHPYTRIEYMQKDIGYGKQTARKYLAELTDHRFVRKVKLGRNNYYINEPLVDLLKSVSKET